jgi:hypothetical protein
VPAHHRVLPILRHQVEEPRNRGGAPMIGDHEIPNDPFWGASPVPEGGRVQITGTNPPCGNCQGQMKSSSEDTGATFEYRWPDGNGGMMSGLRMITELPSLAVKQLD